jgi:uncharacterized protein YcbK (DUF882 family)
MKIMWILGLTLVLSGPCLADDEKDEDKKDTLESVVAEAADGKELTGAEKKELEEQVARIVVEEHNANVDDEMDEVICRNERVTGTRRKVRVCKTRREIEEEKAASRRLMRERSRRGSSPSLPAGVENR